ncbi:MAG: hypothetical protein ACREBH_01830 [Candidatus Micrarchaeaceae archaeon]
MQTRSKLATYRSRWLTDGAVKDILDSVRVIKTDDDWDGVSSAAQLKSYIRDDGIKVEISPKSPVYADSHTIVLDKRFRINSRGALIDHHQPMLKHPNLNILLFADNNIPTSRLVCLVLDQCGYGNRLPRLFLSATAEITDGFHREGEIEGSISELRAMSDKAETQYFRPAKYANLTGWETEIFVMADVLNMIAKKNPEYAFDIALEFCKSPPRDIKDLVNMLNKNNADLVQKFAGCLSRFDYGSFDDVTVNGKRIKLLDNRRAGGFGRYVIEKVRRIVPANYMLFRGAEANMRVRDIEQDSGLVLLIRNALAEKGLLVNSRGRLQGTNRGAAAAYAFKFNNEVGYEYFKGLLRTVS